jgi:DNA-binding transcriptional MerR regulator
MHSIGQLSRTTGCKVETIRYYERIGLMPEPARSEGNQRRYTKAHEQRLGFIRHARELGFSLDSIRELLSMSDEPDASCDTVDRLARQHLEQVQSRIARFQILEDELQRMVTQCRGGKVDDCRILEVLSDHALCAHEHDPERSS